MNRDELKHVVSELIKRQWSAEEGENYLVPLLVGPTQCGKTALVKELAPELGAELVVVLAQAEDPTELLGLGKVVEAGGIPRLTRLFPAWAENIALDGKRFIVFLDEFDKAPSDVYAGLLTLLRSRKIVNRSIPDVAFVAAANSVEDAGWPPELRARFRVFPMSYDWEYEIRKHGYDPFFAEVLRSRLSSDLPPPEIAGDTPTTWLNLYKDLQSLAWSVESHVWDSLLASLFRDESVLAFVRDRLTAGGLTLRYEDLIDVRTASAVVRRLQEGLVRPAVLGKDIVRALAHLLREDASDEERAVGTHLYCSLWLASLREVTKAEQLEDVSGMALGEYALLFSEQAPDLLRGTRVDVEVMKSYTQAMAQEAKRIGDLYKAKVEGGK